MKSSCNDLVDGSDARKVVQSDGLVSDTLTRKGAIIEDTHGDVVCDVVLVSSPWMTWNFPKTTGSSLPKCDVLTGNKWEGKGQT